MLFLYIIKSRLICIQYAYGNYVFIHILLSYECIDKKYIKGNGYTRRWYNSSRFDIVLFLYIIKSRLICIQYAYGNDVFSHIFLCYEWIISI